MRKLHGTGMKNLRIVLTALLLALPAGALASRQLPVDVGTVTSGIGWRLDPFGSGKMMYHHGVDIAVPLGTPVYPTQVGTVYFAGPYKGYGNMVAVDHGNGYITMYGHNGEIKVEPGQKVDTATVLALSGNTGRSTGPHVHYEVRQLPGYAKVRQEQLEKSIEAVVRKNVDSWVENFVSGKGGPEPERFLPEDLNE
jgi:murein DD-endopeptidase MepM/ murein hydrolase activator NlpD